MCVVEGEGGREKAIQTDELKSKQGPCYWTVTNLTGPSHIPRPYFLSTAILMLGGTIDYNPCAKVPQSQPATPLPTLFMIEDTVPGTKKHGECLGKEPLQSHVNGSPQAHVVCMHWHNIEYMVIPRAYIIGCTGKERPEQKD